MSGGHDIPLGGCEWLAWLVLIRISTVNIYLDTLVLLALGKRSLGSKESVLQAYDPRNCGVRLGFPNATCCSPRSRIEVSWKAVTQSTFPELLSLRSVLPLSCSCPFPGRPHLHPRGQLLKTFYNAPRPIPQQPGKSA